MKEAIEYRPLNIPKRDRKKGEYIVCTRTKCNTNVTEKCVLSGKALYTCKHPESHHFQTKGTHPIKKTTVPLKTYSKEIRDYKTFTELHAQELRKFEADPLGYLDLKKILTIETDKPARLQDAMRMYNDWYQDIGVPEVKHKKHSPTTISTELTNLLAFKEALIQREYSFESILLKDIDINHVNAVHVYFTEDKGYANATYNNKLETINRFFKYLIDVKEYDIKNPFQGIKAKPTVASKVYVEAEDFEKLLSVITVENGIKFEKDRGMVKRKSLFRDWLSFYYRLALYTGARPEGLRELKFEDVKEDFVQVYDGKVSKKKKSQQLRFVIRTQEFDALFEELKEFYSLEPGMHLISPKTEKRTTVSNHASKAFGHYWPQIEANYKATLYDLKDTHITLMLQRFGSMYEGIYGAHDSFKTSLENYAKEEVMIKNLRGKSMYG